MKRVFITGISGFVGSHLTEYLLSHDQHVSGFDLHSSGVSVEFHQGELASGGESNFINIEMKKLLQAFERVIVVPEKCEGPLAGEFGGAEIEVGYAKALGPHGLFRLFGLGVSSKIFSRGLVEKNFPRFSFSVWRH